MSWLRLDEFEASDPELVHDEDGNLMEVLVHVRPKIERYPFCCLAPKRRLTLTFPFVLIMFSSWDQSDSIVWLTSCITVAISRSPAANVARN